MKARYRKRAWHVGNRLGKKRGKGVDASSGNIEKLDAKEAASQTVVKMLNKQMLPDGYGTQEARQQGK